MEITFYDSFERVHSNRIYQVWVRHLVDDAVYDTRQSAYPKMDKFFTFRVTSDTPSLKFVYFNGELIESNSSLDFTVNVYPSPNRVNMIYVEDQFGNKTSTIYFNVYNLHYLIFVITTPLRDLLEAIQQSDADRVLTEDNSLGVSSNPFSISDKALFLAFGRFLGVSRLTATSSQYITRLKGVLDAFYYCGTIGGVKRLVEALTSTGEIDFITYRDLEEFRTSTYANVRKKLGGETLEVEWFPAQLRVNGRRYYLDKGDMVMNSGNNFLYVDGTVDSNGHLVVKNSSTEPLGEWQTITETVTENAIYTDTTGEITGTAGSKYVILQRPVTRLISVTSVGGLRPTGAQLVEGCGSLIQLHTLWDVSYIGDLIIQYETYTRPLILAKVTVGGGDPQSIQKIEDPIPSRGAIYREPVAEENDYELYINDEYLSSDEQDQLLSLLEDIVPIAGVGHVYIKDSSATLTEYEYHKEGYTYIQNV